MYQTTLTQSYFPAGGGAEPAPVTIGAMLRPSIVIGSGKIQKSKLGGAFVASTHSFSDGRSFSRRG